MFMVLIDATMYYQAPIMSMFDFGKTSLVAEALRRESEKSSTNPTRLRINVALTSHLLYRIAPTRPCSGQLHKPFCAPRRVPLRSRLLEYPADSQARRQRPPVHGEALQFD
jgi:hypothetical protein